MIRVRDCLAGDEGQPGCKGAASEEMECATQACPRPPGWSEWGDWSECSQTCGNGQRFRVRFCPDSEDCPGESIDNEICNEKGCASWSNWGDWSDCSKTCGEGSTFRFRICENGEPDVDCEGNSTHTLSCITKVCPAPWAQWGDWSNCDATCGDGERVRFRLCENENVGCEGDEIERVECMQLVCPGSWVSWGTWSACDATCGDAERVRFRFCPSGDGNCEGDEMEREECIQLTCPFWTEWSDWSDCSVTCGRGERFRDRTCVEGEFESDCFGAPMETEACNDDMACPFWSEWSDWSECSLPCGGEKSRDRMCVGGEVGMDCFGPPMETVTCASDMACPFWSDWSEWSDCSVTCGVGEKVRDRMCVEGEVGLDCFGPPMETETCNGELVCPFWSEWSEWSDCNVTCGGGERARDRMCVEGEVGSDCFGPPMETEDCNNQVCSFWLEWSEWSLCSVTCGEGERSRSRLCDVSEDGPNCRGSPLETESCVADQVCPFWSEWSEWSECSATCGNGDRARDRSCVDGDAGIDCLGAPFEAEVCTVNQDCPSWGEWSVWSECSSSCGAGETIRSRFCNGGEVDKDCLGSAVETESCLENECPSWGEWSVWSECSSSCGAGETIRSRFCNGGEVDEDCLGSAVETESCLENECPAWGEWSVWSECSSSCGAGETIRSRFCNGGEVDEDCLGSAVETESCLGNDCAQWGEWGSWTDCSATCGDGERFRERECINGEAGSEGCDGDTSEMGDCVGTNADECPMWTPWSTWSDCDISCGGGKKTRSRICVNARFGNGCDGDATEELDCNSQDCPGWTLWESWSACTKSCDGGVRERFRECENGFPGDIGCEEVNGVGEYSDEICNTQLCPRFGAWSEWTECDAPCGTGGTGIRLHTRECIGGDVGQRGCEGPSQEDQACDGGDCPFWSPWSEWGVCTDPCGGGSRSRGRLCVHGEPGKDGCQGPDSQSEICNTKSCASWTNWGQWGSCSRTCGDAERLRIRLCVNGDLGQLGCNGSSTEVDTCPFKDCVGCSPDLELQGFVSGSVACTDGTKIGSICNFACAENFQLVGSQTSTCEEVSSGVSKWSSNVPTCTERCSDQADIVFVIDSSSSIKAPNFKIIRSFIKEIVKRFRIGTDAALIGAVRYNFNVNKLWDLQDYPTLDKVLQAIDAIPYDGSGTLTGRAIQYTNDVMFRPEAGRREGVPKMVVVVTDGVSFDNVSRPASLLKETGALIVAVGIGNVNLGEIKEIASDPDRNFATTVSSFDSLPRVVTTIADQIKLCQPVDIPDNCPPQALVDLVFIVDSSSSIGTANFEIIRKFIRNLVTEFNIGYGSALFGIVLYNRDVKERFQLGDFNTTAQVVNAIDNLPYSGSGTRTGKALRYAATDSFTPRAGARPGVPNVAVVITDGKSQDNVEAASPELQSQANVIAIGIEGAVQTELSAIASFESNVFNTDFASLGELMDQLKMAICFASQTRTG